MLPPQLIELTLMDDQSEILDRYQLMEIAEREDKLNKHSILIKSFIDFCKEKQINLIIDDFDYVRAIGIVAKYPNIVTLLNPKIENDKEELVEVNIFKGKLPDRILEIIDKLVIYRQQSHST
jgi:hypothetical protein